MSVQKSYISMQDREKYRQCALILDMIHVKCHSTEWRIKNGLGGLCGCKLCLFCLPDDIFDLLNNESRDIRLLREL